MLDDPSAPLLSRVLRSGVELVAMHRGLGVLSPELAGVTQWLLFAKDRYDVERAPLASSASEDERRDWFAEVGAELGDGDLHVAFLGRSEPFDVVTLRPHAPFVAWAPALLDRPSPTGAFLFSKTRDVAVLLQRKGVDVVARIAHGASARLIAADERDLGSPGRVARSTSGFEPRERSPRLLAGLQTQSRAATAGHARL
jgi:hypothetical protein